MILRVRSRDGLERVSVADGGRVADLARAVVDQLKLPKDHPVVLSRDQRLLLVKEGPPSAAEFGDLANPGASLSSLGLKQGDIIFLWYSLERTVQGPKVGVVPAGSFGKRMTVEELVARQIRIERQEQPHCSLLSFDRAAANEFQLYVNETLGFSIQRGGFMYGTCSEGGEVRVEFIYEPPQTGTDRSLVLLRDQAEESCVEAIASALGMRRVGFVFTRSTAQSGDEERNYTLTTAELRLAVELHAEALGLPIKRGGEGDEAMPDALSNKDGQQRAGASKEDSPSTAGFKQFSIGIVSLTPNDEGTSDVHFEAFQLSDQCVKLFADGLFADPADPAEAGAPPAGDKEKGADEEQGNSALSVTKMRKEVIVARKDTFEVDNDFFLVAVSICDHEGPLISSFPVENRMIIATDKDLRAYLDKRRNILPFARKLADFHLLLFLSHILDPRTDIPVLAEAVRIDGPIPEGYQLIIESF